MKIRVYATLRPIVGGPTIDLNDASQLTVKEVLETLYQRYPDLKPELYKGRAELHPAIHILVNGKDMRYLDGVNTVVTAEDDLRIFPPVGGGQ